MKYLVNLSLILLLALSSCSSDGKKSGKAKSSANELNVYSYRHNDADKTLFAQFEEETGIKVNVVNASAEELQNKLKKEGESSSVDVLITEDAGQLVKAKNMGFLQSVSSEILNTNVPVKYRDTEGQWYGLTKRVRVLVYNPEVMSAEDFSTYEDLADPKWEGLLAVSSSRFMYNQSLMASVIANSNVEEATNWAKALTSNMFRPSKGDDIEQIKAVYNGEAKVALANSNCMGVMRKSSDPEEKKIGKAMKVFFPNSITSGAHVNISGAGVCKNAPHKENAIKFIEFLSSKEVQAKFSAGISEYPVNPEASQSALLMLLGEFRESKMNVSQLGELNQLAVRALASAGWK